MRRTVFASLRSHRVRLAMTALAVALGTGLMCGSFVFTASLTHSLDALFAQASAGTDVEVRHMSPAGALQGAGSAAAQPVPASVLAPIRALPDVAADGHLDVVAHGEVTGPGGAAIDHDLAKAARRPASSGPPRTSRAAACRSGRATRPGR